MIKVTCSNCGIVFGMSDDIYHQRQKDGKSFTCTNGHSLHYSPSENDRLKKEIERLKARCTSLQDTSSYWQGHYNMASRSLSATKGVATKLKMKLYPERYEP